MSRGSMEAVIRVALGYIKKSVSESTWQQYKSVWLDWERVLTSIDCNWKDGCGVMAVLYYVGRLAEGGCSNSRVDKCTAAIAFNESVCGSPSNKRV